MEKKSKSQITNSFLWISSVLGFIVDTVALLSIMGQVQISGVSMSEPSIRQSLNLGSLFINWSDITLIIIVYVGLIFLLISVRFEPYGIEGLNSLFLFHFFLGLVGLWSLVFIFSGEFIFIPRLVGIWLTGLFSLIWLKSKAANVNIVQFFTNHYIILIVVLPIWALFEKSYYNQSWEKAIWNTFYWGLLGIYTVYILWIIFFLIYWVLRKMLYFSLDVS